MSAPHLPVRPSGDAAPDVIAMDVAHRMMRADLARLVSLAEDIAAGRVRCSYRRAGAIAVYIGLLCDSVESHHKVEDDVLWPIISASAGACVDLSELRDDHAALDLDSLRAAAAAYQTASGSDVAAAVLARRLRALQVLLDDHIEDEERVVFPVVGACVSREDWRRVERAAGGRLSFDLPRTFDHTTAAERVRLVGPWGARVLRVLACVLIPAYRRRERLVFGSTDQLRRAASTAAASSSTRAAAVCRAAAVGSSSACASTASAASTEPKTTDPESRPASRPAYGSRSS